MNIYFLGMCISMAIYIMVGAWVSRKIRTTEDYYVAGRRAPAFLIAGSLIASYTSTGMFMGDASTFFQGAFTPMIILSGMQLAGYIIGAVFFGRYLRRSKVLTIPEFFGKRFCSKKMKNLAAITAVITMTVYLLATVQGIGTLMTVVTGVDYKLCVILALIVFSILTILSGSTGVLITDTMMAALFTGILVVATIIISWRTGGWFHSIAEIAASPQLTDYLSWKGQPGVIYNTGAENVAWGVIYGIVWMSVCMIGPWQSSRYLMAKSEHTVVRSALPAALGIFFLELLVGMSAVFVNLMHPDLDDPSHVLIWAAMNLLPKILGVLLLTGVLAAGISSATTFLSLIGASFANDILGKEKEHHIRTGRIFMVIASVVVLIFALTNPPSIFWIMFLGGAIVSAAWMPVALGCVLSKRLTKAGAFAGMLTGFVACFGMRLFQHFSGVTLPVWLDPSLFGMECNIVAMIIGSALTRVTSEETAAREQMFVVPESERKKDDILGTLRNTKQIGVMGVFITVILLVLWAIPYLRATGRI